MPRSAELTASEPLAVAVGVLRDHRGRVLVNRRPANKPQAGYWEFPGGKIEQGETAWAALVREFEEELGLTLSRGEHLMDLEHAYGERLVSLSVWSVASTAGRPQSREGQVLRWCYPPELRHLDLLPANGPIVDGLSSSTM